MLNKSSYMHANGGLGYIEFLQLTQKIWADSHPDIPLVAQSGEENATYPSITYRLDLRKPIDAETKPRFREEIITDLNKPNIIVSGQRFQNIITFTVYTKDDPHLAEYLIELFEDFMIEFTPVLKELGVSQLLYARRLPDSAEGRTRGIGITERSVSYLVVLEKILTIPVDKLQQILISAREFLQEPYWVYENATPATPVVVVIEDQFSGDATPS